MPGQFDCARTDGNERLCILRNALEDPWDEPNESMFTRSVSPENAPDKPTYIEIEYEKGDPVAIDGRRLSPATLLTNLNKVAGENGDNPCGPQQHPRPNLSSLSALTDSGACRKGNRNAVSTAVHAACPMQCAERVKLFDMDSNLKFQSEREGQSALSSIPSKDSLCQQVSGASTLWNPGSSA